nr:hypothetical protein [uncultured Dyadobacter sp.]
MDKQSKKDLEEKILSKRQQIEFEKKNLDESIEFSPENRENPEVMEEAKNLNDPADSVADPADLRSLRAAEQELQSLLKQLNVLRGK